MPPNMADWLPDDHLVWFVLDVVEQLDTQAFHARSRLGGVGRQGYDPDMLLGLLLYAYAVGERSSRRIERLCVDHVAFRVLCGQDAPDHTTLARFRSQHEDAFADVFAQVLRLCADAGMVRVGVVSIDGTKIAANAARGANRTADAVRREARRIAEEIVAEATQVDAAEDTGSSSDDDLPPGFSQRGGRAANIKKALEELGRQDAEHEQLDEADRIRADAYVSRIEAGEAVRGTPPAGVDPLRLHRARVARYEQIAEHAPVASTRREARASARKAAKALARAEERVAAGEIDLRGRRARAREQTARRQRERGGTGPTINVTDPDSRLMTHGAGGGTVQGYNAQVAVTDDHLVLGVHVSQDANDTHCFAPTLTAAIGAGADLDLEIGTVLADAGYFTTENLTMPGPTRLIAPGKHRTMAAAIDIDAGPPVEDTDPLDAMRHRLKHPEQAAIYKRRSATVETVIAHLKEQVGLRRFSRRGLSAATAELNLAATVVNLRRLHAAVP